jgi:phosphotransferase system enzyme I (PtsI)
LVVIKGVPASPGIAIGKAYVLEDEEIIISRQEIPPGRIRVEVKRFKNALDKTHRDLDATEAKVLKTLGKEHARLIETHRLILSDPLIKKEVPRRILAERVNAEFALSEALEQVNRQFEKIQDEFFRERRHDLFDVGKRLLSHLLKQEKQPLSEIKEPAILVARNLLPSDTLNLKDAEVLAFATDLGGRTSHTAILAQSLEIPAVVGLSDVSHRVRSGDWVIIDGEDGLVIINPEAETLVKYRQAQERALAQEQALEALKGLAGKTQDGHPVTLLANLDTLDETKTVVHLGTDGIGLFRTEFLYLNRTTPPSEEEQFKIFTQVIKALGDKPVVIRTADIGGDRLTQLGLEGPPSETNPFMGLRGIRLSLRYPKLFKTHLRAILRAAVNGDVRVMLPMVSSLVELQSAKKLIQQTLRELAAEGRPTPENVPLGIMVEVPSAVLLLDRLLDEIEFVSVGTNDLVQYLLAVDRVNEHVSYLYEPFHPAVLRVLDQIVQVARRKNKWVSLCGEMGSDPRAVPLLIGLGIEALSISPRMFLRVKQAVRSISRKSARELVEKALQASDPSEVQRLLAQARGEGE